MWDVGEVIAFAGGLGVLRRQYGCNLAQVCNVNRKEVCCLRRRETWKVRVISPLHREWCTYPEEYPLKYAQLVANQMETSQSLGMPLLRDSAVLKASLTLSLWNQ